MASRLSQEVVEILSTTTPRARLTQEVVEVLATTTPRARLTQLVVEVLTNPTAAPPPPVGATQPHVQVVS